MKTQNHLGSKLDEKLNLRADLKSLVLLIKYWNVEKTERLCSTIFLNNCYKSFVTPRLDHAEIIHEKPNNINICIRSQSLQYNDALAITTVIWGSSNRKLYKQLGSEYLSSRRWLRKLCLFHKIVLKKLVNYRISFKIFHVEQNTLKTLTNRSRN